MNDDSENALREEAMKLLPGLPLLRDWLDLRADDPTDDRRAFIIEVAGMPKAGKSSAIDNLRHFFSHGYKVKVGNKTSQFNARQNQYEVYTPAEGVSLRTPGFLKRNLVDYNTWAGAYGLQELLQAAHDTHHDLVILDRGPWDAGCWLEYWKSHVKQDDATSSQQVVSDVESIAHFFQLEHWMTRADLHVVLVVDPDHGARREERSRLIAHGGIASKVGDMQELRAIYEKQFKNLQTVKANKCSYLGDLSARLYDTTNEQPHRVTLRIIEAVLAALERKVNHYAEHMDVDFDAAWVEVQLSGYLPKVRGRKKMLEFLPAFIEEVRTLTPIQKFRLRRSIEEARAPADLNVGARAPKGGHEENPLKSTLEELLRRVKTNEVRAFHQVVGLEVSNRSQLRGLSDALRGFGGGRTA